MITTDTNVDANFGSDTLLDESSTTYYEDGDTYILQPPVKYEERYKQIINEFEEEKRRLNQLVEGYEGKLINSWQFTDEEMETLESILENGFLFGGHKDDWQKVNRLVKEYFSKLGWDDVNLIRLQCEHLLDAGYSRTNGVPEDFENIFGIEDIRRNKMHHAPSFSQLLYNRGMLSLDTSLKMEWFARYEISDRFIGATVLGLPSLVEDINGNKELIKELAEIEGEIIRRGGLMIGATSHPERAYVCFPFVTDTVMNKLKNSHSLATIDIPSAKEIIQMLVMSGGTGNGYIGDDDTLLNDEARWIPSGNHYNEDQEYLMRELSELRRLAKMGAITSIEYSEMASNLYDRFNDED